MSKRIAISIFIVLIFAAAVFIFFWPTPKATTTTDVIECKPSAPDTGANVKISMGDNEYEPNIITINKGDAVSFVNNSSSDRWPASNLHPTHEIYSEFDPKCSVKPGETWTFVFDQAGVWRMHDHITPFIKGKITVQ